MKILLPESIDRTWNEYLLQTALAEPLPIFSEVCVSFISELSQSILSNQRFRKFPELIALAFWMRKTHLMELKREFEQEKGTRVLLPRGQVVHFAPSNVDTIFVYSWFLSLLMGNSNVVRISQKQSEQLTVLLQVVNELMAKSQYKEIQSRTMVVTYPHDEAVTEKLVSYCNMRVIWGGDEAVRSIRKIPMPSHATELVFGDKFSLAAIRAESYLLAGSREQTRVAEHFYNDAIWFDQMACSSPRVVCWVGDSQQNQAAKQIFWSQLDGMVSKKQPEIAPATIMNKWVAGLTLSAEGKADRFYLQSQNHIHRVQLSEPYHLSREQHCGGGLFLEADFNDLAQLKTLLTPKDQTLSIYGFEQQELHRFASSLAGAGIDRIVPVGQALQFHTVWDGHRLFEMFTREVHIAN